MDIKQLKAHEIQRLIRSKEVSCEEITKLQYKQIEAVEGEIGAYISLDSDSALAQAKKVDTKIAEGEAIAPLAGIPMGIKDNICTKGIKTTCASKILGNFIPPYDATVMKKLNAQDIVMLGKLNMDEFAMGSTTENSYYKKTKNPCNIERVPGGSSGGSAASVAAGEAVISLGSDTGGSIRQPAAFCGVVGMKPTYGAVSRFGLVAFASSLDQIGPITKDVKDMALAMNGILGYDPMDSTSIKRSYTDLTQGLDGNIKGMKVALPKEYFGEGLNPEIKASVLKAASDLEKLGAIVEEVSMPSLDFALPAYYVISSAEASSNLARFDGVKYGYRTDEYLNLEELYKKSRSEGFGKEVKRRIMLGTFALSSGYYDAYYKKAQQVRSLVVREFADIFKRYDVILSPVTPTTAYPFGSKTENPLEMYMGDIYTVPVNIAGLPALSMNCGFDKEEMPIGMQFIGKAFDESTIIKVAYAYEQYFGKTMGGER